MGPIDPAIYRACEKRKAFCECECDAMGAEAWEGEISKATMDAKALNSHGLAVPHRGLCFFTMTERGIYLAMVNGT